MTGLLESPVLCFRNRGRRFRITDAGGRLLGRSVPVRGDDGPGARERFTGQENVAFTVQVHDADGSPLVLIESVEDGPGIAVKEATGKPIGRIAGIQGERRGRLLAMRERLVGPDEEPLGTIVWKPRSPRYEAYTTYCDFYSADGLRVGHFERGVLRLDHRFAFPLQGLLVVSPIVFHIKAGG